MGLISIDEMEFYSPVGCFKEEKLTRNKILVSFEFDTDTSIPEQSDNIVDTVNYQVIYDIIKQETIAPVNLIEHLARKALDKIMLTFPQITNAKIKVSKINPAMGGQIKSVSVVLKS